MCVCVLICVRVRVRVRVRVSVFVFACVRLLYDSFFATFVSVCLSVCLSVCGQTEQHRGKVQFPPFFWLTLFLVFLLFQAALASLSLSLSLSKTPGMHSQALHLYSK